MMMSDFCTLWNAFTHTHTNVLGRRGALSPRRHGHREPPGEQREQRRVAQALEGEDLARELGEAQQPQQAQEPQRPQAL